MNLTTDWGADISEKIGGLHPLSLTSFLGEGLEERRARPKIVFGLSVHSEFKNSSLVSGDTDAEEV